MPILIAVQKYSYPNCTKLKCKMGSEQAAALKLHEKDVGTAF